jgi:CheY-like chemotaxis protein/HPt (histidine-containing phosphotransfer) domain-containing protein
MKANKVLIVDDNNLNRKVFEHIIGLMYQFDIAENGQVALDKIRNEHFDLILMDIQMPVLDGINTLKAIKTENLTDAPVVAVSAFANQKDRDYFISMGFDDFIPKPIKPKMLLETLELYLKKKSPESSDIDAEEPVLDDEFDQNKVRQLLKYNSSANIKQVYEEFVQECESLLAEIKVLAVKKDFEAIGDKLHIIKGNSGTFGAMAIYTYCQKFEKNIKSHNFEHTVEESVYLGWLIDSFKNKIQHSELLNP